VEREELIVLPEAEAYEGGGGNSSAEYLEDASEDRRFGLWIGEKRPDIPKSPHRPRVVFFTCTHLVRCSMYRGGRRWFSPNVKANAKRVPPPAGDSQLNIFSVSQELPDSSAPTPEIASVVVAPPRSELSKRSRQVKPSSLAEVNQTLSVEAWEEKSVQPISRFQPLMVSLQVAPMPRHKNHRSTHKKLEAIAAVSTLIDLTRPHSSQARHFIAQANERNFTAPLSPASRKRQREIPLALSPRVCVANDSLSFIQQHYQEGPQRMASSSPPLPAHDEVAQYVLLTRYVIRRRQVPFFSSPPLFSHVLTPLQGLGLRLKNIMGRAVVGGFTEEYLANQNPSQATEIRIGDIIMAVESTDTSNPVLCPFAKVVKCLHKAGDVREKSSGLQGLQQQQLSIGDDPSHLTQRLTSAARFNDTITLRLARGLPSRDQVQPQGQALMVEFVSESMSL
jgi:hypothetical protein